MILRLKEPLFFFKKKKLYILFLQLVWFIFIGIIECIYHGLELLFVCVRYYEVYIHICSLIKACIVMAVLQRKYQSSFSLLFSHFVHKWAVFAGSL